MSLLTINAPNVEPLVNSNQTAVAFLSRVLTTGEIAVPVLEAQARVLGLLGEQQAITNSKRFRRAQRHLGVQSRRVGFFGGNGQWSWGLKSRPRRQSGNYGAQRREALEAAQWRNAG